MTPAEKRYFKMHFAFQKNAVTLIYDLLNELETYDEEKLKELLPEKVAEKLKVYKIRLYERLLKSLSSYNAKKNILSKIRIGLEEVELLMSKKLYDIAADHLKKIKEISQQYEEYSYLVEIAYLEFRLLNISMDKIGISLHPVFKELDVYLHKLNQQVNISQIGHKLIDYQKTFYHKTSIPEEDHQWLQGILTEELPVHEKGGLTFRASLSRNIVLSVIYQFLGKPALEFEARKNNVELFRQFPQFKESLTFNYIAVLRNYMNFCLKEEKYEEVKRVVEEAKKFISEKTPHEVPQLIYFYYSELQMLYLQGQFKTITIDYGPMIEAFTEKNNIKGERISVISFIYVILSELFENNHSKVQYYLRVINEADEEIKAYFEDFFTLLDLLSHYEAHDTHTLLHHIQRIRRKRVFAEEPVDFFESMINWLEKLLKYPDQKAIIAKEMKEECRKKFSEDLTMASFKHYRLDYWCGALTKGTSLREEMLEQLNKKMISHQ